jgi:plasmid stabilization system protein ParE
MNVRWNRPAERDYRHSLLYIAEYSIVASMAVRHRIDRKVEMLRQHPGKYPPDPLKRDNDGTFRAFTSDSLRISYRVFKDSIHIMRVRHVKRKPLPY